MTHCCRHLGCIPKLLGRCRCDAEATTSDDDISLTAVGLILNGTYESSGGGVVMQVCGSHMKHFLDS